MSAAAFDHPLLSGLLGDEEVAPQFTAAAMLEEYAWFEEALARAEAAEGVIPAAAAEAIATACQGFAPDLAALRAGAARDGVAVPEYVRLLRQRVGEPYGQYLHFGATSQDLVDTGLIRRLAPVLDLFDGRLTALIGAMRELAARFGGNRLMGMTRMQPARPITVADRLAQWRAPLERHLERLQQLEPRLLVLQFGGAVGTLDQFGDRGPAVARRLAEGLDLSLPERPWHAARDNIAELGGWLALVCGSLGKLGADVALMAQAGVGEIALAGGGTSSAMPDKRNPVGAEVLMALARYGAILSSGLDQALDAEGERSGAAWTLEWLTLPPLVMTTGAALRTAATLLAGIEQLGEAP
jgi:3-carboxy-cis,cis-muconate cycloisomerase